MGDVCRCLHRAATIPSNDGQIVKKDVILVVDDDTQITSFLKRYLEKQGYAVLCAGNSHEMQQTLDRNDVDLCVLDIGLPGKNGLDITRDIRKDSNLPILVLSGSSDTLDRVVGLEFGADDYMVKPYEPRELLARVRAILRRSNAAEQSVANGASYGFDKWVVDENTRSLSHLDDGRNEPVTTTEFNLLQLFVTNPHKVFNRNQLLDAARGRESFAGDRTIDVHVMRLRKKLGVDESGAEFIKTIHGVGYSFIAKVVRKS